MGELRLTLFELHGDLAIGPKSFGVDDEESAGSTDRSTDGSAASTADTGGSGIALLVGLVFLAVIGLAVKRQLGDSGEATVEQPVELAESDEL
jgi:hypothetical protein